MRLANATKLAGKCTRAVGEFFGNIASVMLFAMMFLGACDVIGRYLFNNPILGAAEFSQIMMGGMVFLGWAHTQRKMSHVSVDILFILYPQRIKDILRFATTLIIFILFAIIFWESIDLALTDWREGKLMNIVHIPIAPFKALIPVGAFFLCLECIVQMVDMAPAAFQGKEKECCLLS